MKWVVAGCCFLVALFCVYGFIASGELHGSEGTMWKGGYATLGAVSLLGGMATAGKTESEPEG